jgi:hypothetical protein
MPGLACRGRAYQNAQANNFRIALYCRSVVILNTSCDNHHVGNAPAAMMAIGRISIGPCLQGQTSWAWKTTNFRPCSDSVS